MTVYTIKIKSAITPWLWYSEKVGEVHKGVKHHTDSLFWFPGDVYNTSHGYIHEQDAEIIGKEESVNPIHNN